MNLATISLAALCHADGNLAELQTVEFAWPDAALTLAELADLRAALALVHDALVRLGLHDGEVIPALSVPDADDDARHHRQAIAELQSAVRSLRLLLSAGRLTVPNAIVVRGSCYVVQTVLDTITAAIDEPLEVAEMRVALSA